MGLGSLHTLSLAEARERARLQRQVRLDGKDPLTVRRAVRNAAAIAAAKAITFRACAEAYIESHKAGWRNPKHVAQWRQSLTKHVFPTIGPLSVSTIDLVLTLKVIEPLWAMKPETASRVRGRIEAVLDWAKTRGYRDGENPARWRGHLENLLPRKSKVAPVAHFAALPYAEIGAFMGDLRKSNGVGAHALEFAILTATRTNEVLGARWNEIDTANRVWTIPGARMKAGREHRVPLSAAATAIIDKMADRRESDFVFPSARGNRPLSSETMKRALEAMKRTNITVHGFRSTFSDWCAERTAFPADVREMALAHAVGDKVEAAYRRGDLFEKRRQLAEAWAKYCSQPPTTGRVVPIHEPGARTVNR
jgi:integrase